MSKTTKPLKLKIYNRNPGTISTGANTQIELDGKPIPLVSFLKLELKPNKAAKLTMEMYVDVDAAVEAELFANGIRTLQEDAKYVIGQYTTQSETKK